MTSRTWLLCLAGAGLLSPSRHVTCDPRFLGTWEYRQAAGPGFDAEGERLVLSCRSGSMYGLYFGLERAGEHGLFYTLVEMQALKITPDSALAFMVGERDLFSERPRSLDDIRQKKVPWAGVTRDTLVMRGGLEQGNLVLTCTSTVHLCPDKVMIFHKGSW